LKIESSGRSKAALRKTISAEERSIKINSLILPLPTQLNQVLILKYPESPPAKLMSSCPDGSRFGGSLDLLDP
jgi:hypothetical protein